MKCMVFLVPTAIFCQIVSSTPHFRHHHRFHDHDGYNSRYRGPDSSWSNSDNHGPAKAQYGNWSGDSHFKSQTNYTDRWVDWFKRTTTTRSLPTQTTQQISACVSSCPVTAEYNPVCGSNHITYPNPGWLECEQNCGVVVKLTKYSACDVDEHPTVENSTSVNVELSSTISSISSTSASSHINDIPDQIANNGNSGIKSYGNNGTIRDGANDSYNKKKPPTVQEVTECMQTCCLTSEYNPVCGTDNITYMNPGRLLCSRFCGIDVEVAKFMPCYSNTIDNHVNHCITTCTNPSVTMTVNPGPVAPTPSLETCMNSCTASSSYLPICGTNNVTYNNLEELQCARRCGIDVELEHLSPCTVMLPTTPNLTSTTETVPDVMPDNIDPTTNATIPLVELSKIWSEATTTPKEEEYELDERAGSKQKN